MALGTEGVRHAALLRDPARATPLAAERHEQDDVEADDRGGPTDPATDHGRPTLEPADVELGLRYLTDFRVLVVAEPLPDAIVRVAAEAASFSSARLVVVAADAAEPPAGLPADALVLDSGGAEDGGAFAALLGRVAAAIDAGATAEEAVTRAATSVGAIRPG
jgi:hypothetical protein